MRQWLKAGCSFLIPRDSRRHGRHGQEQNKSAFSSVSAYMANVNMRMGRGIRLALQCRYLHLTQALWAHVIAAGENRHIFRGD